MEIGLGTTLLLHLDVPVWQNVQGAVISPQKRTGGRSVFIDYTLAVHIAVILVFTRQTPAFLEKTT